MNVKTKVNELVASVILAMKEYGVVKHSNLMLNKGSTTRDTITMDSLYVVDSMGDIISGDLTKCLEITSLESFELMIEVMAGNFFTSLNGRLELLSDNAVNARELD